MSLAVFENINFFLEKKMSSGQSGGGGSRGATVDLIWEHRDVRFDIPVS